MNKIETPLKSTDEYFYALGEWQLVQLNAADGYLYFNKRHNGMLNIIACIQVILQKG